EGLFDVIQVPIRIDNVDRPPTLVVFDHQAVLNQQLSFLVSGHDPDAEDTLSYSAQDLPDGATLNAQTGQFLWTPCPAQEGDYIVTFRVFDGQYTAAQNVVIHAVQTPRLPTVTVELTPSFPATPGQAVLLHAAAAGVANITALQVTVNGQPVT